MGREHVGQIAQAYGDAGFDRVFVAQNSNNPDSQVATY